METSTEQPPVAAQLDMASQLNSVRKEPAGRKPFCTSSAEMATGCADPWGGVIMDFAGNLYGTCLNSGIPQNEAIFQLSQSNGVRGAKSDLQLPLSGR